jgi:hypothetical protein
LRKKVDVVKRPSECGAFEFAVLAGLRAAQLMRGCAPRIASAQKLIVTAQMEIAEGKVARAGDVSSADMVIVK